MKLYSINDENNRVTFRQAVLQGIAADGGLFMPLEIPKLPSSFISNPEHLSFTEIAYEIASLFLRDEIPADALQTIIASALNFDAPLVRLDERLHILELFHGPTLAFKDFGARFMAEMISFFNKNNSREVTILVATSGDTGSAVAHGFYNQPGIRVVLLYPSGKVSGIQEKQLTTLGGNVKALEVDGTFDDCQRLVKSAFADGDLRRRKQLSSANSINIARLLPQSFYYFSAYGQLEEKALPLYISVPSGNLGNLTAGLMAREMGLPVTRFISALNANDVFGEYLHSGIFRPRKAIPTISNAMDVGNPSNLARIVALYQNDIKKIREVIYSAAFSDDETYKAIGEVFSRYGYIPDPHGAVGWLALDKYLAEHPGDKRCNGIVLETAHPAKFVTAVSKAISQEVEIPARLRACLNKPKQSIPISAEFSDFKDFLLNG